MKVNKLSSVETTVLWQPIRKDGAKIVVGFIVGLITALAIWPALDSLKNKERLDLQYQGGFKEGKAKAEEEFKNQLVRERQKIREAEQRLLLFKLGQSLAGVLEIQDWIPKTVLRRRTAIGGGIDGYKEIRHGRYDYFSFITCPKSGCALALAGVPDKECFLIHFTGEIPDRKRGIEIEEGARVSFY